MQRSTVLKAVGVLALFVAVGWALNDAYFSLLIQLVGVYGLLALSLNLLFGYAGQISLGHSVFFAIGAYGSAILQTRFGLPGWLSWLAAMVISAAMAIVIGIPILRLKGHFLALATLALALIAQQVLVAEQDWTGGFDGIFVSNQEVLGPALTAVLPYLVVVSYAAVFTVMVLVGRSMPGRAMQMLRANEAVAQSLGVNTTRYKVVAFAASAAIAALAGSFFLHIMRIITPGTFGLITSINIILILVIGGVGSNWGSLLAAVMFVVLPETLRDFAEYAALIYATIVLVVLLFAPGGLAGILRAPANWIRTRSRGAPATEPAEQPSGVVLTKTDDA